MKTNNWSVIEKHLIQCIMYLMVNYVLLCISVYECKLTFTIRVICPPLDNLDLCKVIRKYVYVMHIVIYAGYTSTSFDNDFKEEMLEYTFPWD